MTNYSTQDIIRASNSHYGINPSDNYLKDNLRRCKTMDREYNDMLTSKFFDIVEYYRLSHNKNMWSDLLELDLCWIILGWD